MAVQLPGTKFVLLFLNCCEFTIKQRFNKSVCIFTTGLIICSMHKLKDFIEWKAFGVCTAIGEKLGIATSRIRLWFIYISFLTMGSPLIVYMIMAFWLNIKKYILSARRNPLKYL